MNDAEKLMSEYPELTFKFERSMPEKQKGLIYDDIVYLNPNQSLQDLTETVAEEISHYLTSSGNIIDQSDIQNRKQEQKARDIASFMLVSPASLIECYENGCTQVWECAEQIGVSEELLRRAITWYSRKWEGIWTKEGYAIYFRPDGTLGMFKSLQ